MSKSGFSRAGFLPARVIHLHPSRFCNLACQHCYSASGPHVRGELAAAEVLSALALLNGEGYEVLSLSGGEPLLYSGFETVVRCAAALGFRINLITNGAPVGGRLVDLIVQYVNLIAISIDGAPETHTELRGDSNAFTRAERAMDRLTTAGVRYGLSYCISRQSLADMPWAVEFAREKGAALVHFHPFAATGRGRFVAERFSLTETDKARAYVIASLLDTGDLPRVQIDLAPLDAVRARRSDYAALMLDDARHALLSDLVNPLVIDERGRVLPFSYGMNPTLGIGQIGPDLAAAVAGYKTKSWRRLRALLGTTFDRLDTRGEGFIDWFYFLVETSYAVESKIKPFDERFLALEQEKSS